MFYSFIAASMFAREQRVEDDMIKLGKLMIIVEKLTKNQELNDEEKHMIDNIEIEVLGN